MLALTPAWQKTAWAPSSHWDSFMSKVKTHSRKNTFGSLFHICCTEPAFICSPEPPIIDGDPHSNRIEPLGGNAILNCEVRGDPLPTIQWSKNGINIHISNRIRQLDNGSLAIYGTVVRPHRRQKALASCCVSTKIWLRLCV